MVSEQDIPLLSLDEDGHVFCVKRGDACSERTADAQGDRGQGVKWTVPEGPGQESRASPTHGGGLETLHKPLTLSVSRFPGGVNGKGLSLLTASWECDVA